MIDFVAIIFWLLLSHFPLSWPSRFFLNLSQIFDAVPYVDSASILIVVLVSVFLQSTFRTSSIICCPLSGSPEGIMCCQCQDGQTVKPKNGNTNRFTSCPPLNYKTQWSASKDKRKIICTKGCSLLLGLTYKRDAGRAPMVVIRPFTFSLKDWPTHGSDPTPVARGKK